MLQEKFGVYNDLRKDEISEPNIFYVMITGGDVKPKRGMILCSSKITKRMYATVTHNRYCENVQGLLFIVMPNISVVFPQVIFISIRTC